MDLADVVSKPKEELQTPALLVDLPAMEFNLQTMAQFFSGKSARLRPHFKNHRVLELARRQFECGAIGITCARLWQAERLVESGIRSVLIANELAGHDVLRRFAELSRMAPVVLAVDNENVVRDLGRVSRDLRVPLNIVVDVDLGLRRCGVVPGEAAVNLAKRVAEEGLHFRGIMGYEGHLQPQVPGPEKTRTVSNAMTALVDSKSRIEAAGLPVEIVSCGGTGDYSLSGVFPGVTEIQAGSYLLMDTWYQPFAADFRQTLTVLATVISKTPGERIVVDAGVKAISGERGLPSVKNGHGLKVRALHAEHAPIDFIDGGNEVAVGDKIELAVQYHDGTMQLHSNLFGIRGGKVEKVFKIEH